MTAPRLTPAIERSPFCPSPFAAVISSYGAKEWSKS
jgi:hypothetical protein